MTSPARPPLYLVDDDEAVLDSLRFMLESCDERQLFSFADGERFLAEVDLHQPACLILDCRMPGLSGPEVQQRLKAESDDNVRGLLEVALARFGADDGGFHDTADDAEALYVRPRDVSDNPTPSGTSALVGLFFICMSAQLDLKSAPQAMSLLVVSISSSLGVGSPLG